MFKLMNLIAVTGALVVSAPAAAAITTIDFEAQGAGAPSFFPSPNPSGPLTISGVTLSGGTLLKNESGSTDLSAVYATTNLVSGAYANPLLVNFSSTVNAFSFDLVNEIADTYTLLANNGLTQTFVVAANATQSFSLSGAGITNFTIAASGSRFDFAIDNLVFNTTAAAVPEPASWAMMLLGFGAIGGAMRLGRRKSMALRT